MGSASLQRIQRPPRDRQAPSPKGRRPVAPRQARQDGPRLCARQNGKNEVVALLSEPRYARRQRRASDRLRAARAAARRRGHMRARAVVSICVPAFACRWRTNGGGSPWGLTGSSPRSTTLPMERLDTTHVLPSSCLVAVRVRSAVVGAPGVGGGAAARWPSVAAEVGRAGRPPRTAAPPKTATLARCACPRALLDCLR